MESIHFEKQEASLCAQHAVNMLLQGSYFTAVDLAEIASDVDNREGRVLDDGDTKSHNVDDSGYFSLQVIAEALKVFNLELIPLNSPRAQAYREDPTLGQAYICNLNEHWFAVRRLGFQWFTLNSLLPMPRLISDTYLSLFFAQLTNDGYSIFVVDGVLPPCIADEQLAQCPVDPALAGMSDSFRDDQSQDPNIARAKALSNTKFPYQSSSDKEDDELRLALELSRQTLAEDEARRAALKRGKSVDARLVENFDDDDEMERQLQKAILLSMECYREEDAPGPSTSKPVAAATIVTSVVTENVSNEKSDAENDSKDVHNESLRQKREDFLKRFEK